MRIGLIYDVFESYEWQDGDPPDADAEFEPMATVDALADAVAALGHDPVRIGTARDLLARLDRLDVDAAINIAEAGATRNREGYVPVLLELAGIPFLGSDALTLSLSLDKVWTKDLAAAAGVPTPAYRVYASPDAVDASDLPGLFPLFVKPRYEGSSKGIHPGSRVESVAALRAEIERAVALYRQDVLVEPFIDGGGEWTVAVVGNEPPEALPVLQRALEQETRIGLHALEHRGAAASAAWSYDLEGSLSPALERTLQALAVRVYEKLECLDFARIDFRVDVAGQPWFLEINPLPTFDPDGTFAILAELMNRPYEAFLADVLSRGLRRLRLGP